MATNQPVPDRPRRATRWSRRRFLGAAGAAAAGLALPGVPMHRAAAAPSGRATEFAAIRAAWRDLLTGGGSDPADPDVAAAIAILDESVERSVSLVERSSARDRVFRDLSLAGSGRPASSRMRDTYLRLAEMATAFRTPGSRHADDEAILGDVLAGLDTVNVEVYNASQPQFGSWFHFQISAPHALGNTCVLVHEHIPAEALARYVAAIDHFRPRPNGTGANRVDTCQTVLVRGVIGDDAAKVEAARDGLSRVFGYTTDGDGFHRDGSFIQHETLASTGSYGVELLGGFSNLGIAKQIALLAGTQWAITGPERQFVLDLVDRTYAPVVYDDQVLEFVRGRSISREGQSGHDRGRLVTESIARLARAADPDTARRWRAMCKGWLQRHTFRGPFADADVAQVALFKRLLEDGDLPAASEPVGHTLLAEMDRAIHRRPGWAYAISMASERISYYETINNENVTGFHTGDGMTYLYDADNGHYSDDFWPTADPYRLAGITVDSTPLPDSAGGPGNRGRPRPDSAAWVGGAVVDGTHAAIGMQLEPLMTSLRGHKSWFCLDDAVVALGAGIHGGGPDHPVETVVEHRNLGADGEPAWTIDGDPQPTEVGWRDTRPTGWAHLEGVGGYLFPGRPRLNALREARTGAWSDIGNLGGDASTEPITRRYATMWFDHGIQPQGAHYAYLLLPGASVDQTRRRAARSGVEIVANTPEVQAVRVDALDLMAVNFWEPGTIAGIRAYGPCSVVITGWRRRRPREMTVAVADPTQLQQDLTLRLAAPGFADFEADPTITVTDVHPLVHLTIDTSAADGRSHTAAFASG